MGNPASEPGPETANAAPVDAPDSVPNAPQSDATPSDPVPDAVAPATAPE
jgi:hypothetical protein